MRISEVAKITGLNVSNIRFYEKKGLLSPNRIGEGNYRDYSEEDIKNLKKIILYRKMDIPVETIFLMQNKEVSIDEILERQEQQLLEQQKRLQGSINLCRKIRKETNLEKIDVDLYLNFVEEEEIKGHQFVEIEELLEDFAEFTQLTTFRADRYIGKFLSISWVMKIITVLWGIFAIIWPILIILDKYYDNGKVHPFFLILAIVWYPYLTFWFFKFRKGKRKQREDEE